MIFTHKLKVYIYFPSKFKSAFEVFGKISDAEPNNLGLWPPDGVCPWTHLNMVGQPQVGCQLSFLRL